MKIKKFLILLLFAISTIATAQVTLTPVTSGMNGLQVRTAINSNDSLLNSTKVSNDSLNALIAQYDSLFGGVSSYISVKSYGAVQDGVTDNTWAFKRAFAAARDQNKTLFIPNENGLYYRIDTTITLTGYAKDKNLRIIGNGATLDFSNIVNNALGGISISGTVGTVRSLTQNIEAGDTVIYGNFTGVQRNDILIIESSGLYFAGNYCQRGEFVQVSENLSNTAIILYNSVYDSYTTATTNATLINAPSATIDGLNFIYDYSIPAGGAQPATFFIQYFNNVLITNCSFRDNYIEHVRVFNSYNVRFRDCKTFNSDAQGLGYGISCTSSQLIRVSNCQMWSVRHGFTCGHGGNYPIPARDIIVENCESAGGNTYRGTFDTHECVENITFRNNIGYNSGFNIRNVDAVIEGNTVWMDLPGEVVAITVPLRPNIYNPHSRYVVKDNIFDVKDTTAFNSGIGIYGSGTMPIADNIIIENNYINVDYMALFVFFVDTPGIIENLLLKNNTFHQRTNYDIEALVNFAGQATQSGGGGMVYNRAKINNMVIDGDRYTNGGSMLILSNTARKIENLTIKNTYIKSRGGGIFIDSVENYRFENNEKYSVRSDTISVYGNAHILNNLFTGTGGLVLMNTCDTSFVRGNIFYKRSTRIEDNAQVSDLSDVRTWVTPVATNNGLTTGLLKHNSQDITVTSSNADYIVCLPTTGTSTIGMKITGSIGANGFELRPIAAQAGTIYINNVTTNVEAAIPANSTFEIRCIDATHWLLKVWAADGTYSAPIPDAI
jgi:hypothetical protein